VLTGGHLEWWCMGWQSAVYVICNILVKIVVQMQIYGGMEMYMMNIYSKLKTRANGLDHNCTPNTRCYIAVCMHCSCVFPGCFSLKYCRPVYRVIWWFGVALVGLKPSGIVLASGLPVIFFSPSLNANHPLSDCGSTATIWKLIIANNNFFNLQNIASITLV